mgnify:CR=1 FL=1
MLTLMVPAESLAEGPRQAAQTQLAEVARAKSAAARKAAFAGQGDLFADYQVGVVRNADREGPEAFETGCRAIIDPDVMNAGQNFGDVHNM